MKTLIQFWPNGKRITQAKLADVNGDTSKSI